MIFQISYIVFILFIWFNTKSFIEYSILFGLEKRFKIDLFISYKDVNPLITYNEYLLLKHNSFFTRLITCKPCFCFWITIIIMLMSNTTIILLPIIYLSAYIIYKILDRYVF